MGSANPHIRRREQALLVLKHLEEAGFEARFAGGCVRDRLLGLVPKDFDVASTTLPDETMQVMKNAGYKVVPTGIDHGTITIVTKEGPVEVTTLRKDVNTDGRHAQVEFGGASFEDDAARRDFTMNAMFEDRHGVVSDFHNGQEHIKRGIIQFVGDPNARIQEDYLRTMRFFRFWARFDLEPSEDCIEAISQNLDGLSELSQERITSELWGLLQSDKPQTALISMHKTGVLKKVIPELTSPGTLVDKLQPLKAKWRPAARLALLLLESDLTDTDITPIGARLRLPIEEITRTKAALSGIHRLKKVGNTTTNAMDFVDFTDQHGGELAFTDAFLLLWNVWFSASNQEELQVALKFVNEVEETKGYLRRAKMPINGHDVMKHLDLPAGQELGRQLGSLKAAFRNEEWKTRREGFSWLDRQESQ